MIQEIMEKKNWLVSLVIVAVALTALWTICPICFQNNDDKVLMYLTTGYTTGTPEAGTVFGSFYYYGIIALFYKIYSSLAWYTIFELGMVAASLWIIATSFKSIVGKVAFIIMFLFCFMHFSTALQYTATAGLVAGAAACSLIASMESEKLLESRFVIAVIMQVCAYGIRKQFGLVGFAAVLIILFFQFFAENGESRRLVLKKTAIMVIAMAFAFGSNAIYEKATGIAEFNEYYAQAGTWIDYPHLPYEEDVNGVYASVGWDESLYNAASNWFFMDENLTTENFATIVNAYQGAYLTKREYVERAYNLILASQVVNIQVVIWIALLLLSNILAIKKLINKKAILTIDALFGMFAVVSIYFLIQARFPMRAYQALVFIFFVPSVTLMIQALSKLESKKPLIATAGLMTVIMIAGFTLKPDTNMVKYTYTVAHDIYREADINQSNSLENYAIEHPDNMYIYDLSLALPADPFTVYKNGVPKNLVFWGGWVYNTPMYWKQIHANGFDTLFIDQFVGGNVYFCGTEVSHTLIDYVTVRNPNVTVTRTDEFDGIIIYNFVY